MNTSRKSKWDTTALLTSSRSCTRSRSYFSCCVCRLRALGVQHIVHGNSDLVCHLLHKVDLYFLIGLCCKLPNPMAPRRRCAVVSGTTQNDWTPFSSSMAISFGNRCSFVISFTVKGCWVFHTNPREIHQRVAPDRG